MSVLEIILIVTAGTIGGLILVFAGVRRMAAHREQAMRERFPTARAILPNVNFFGQESNGATQLRGNGTMVLTSSEIVFERWVPRKEYRIPFARIQAIETPRAFLGKSVGRQLLKVVYTNDSGQSDSIAWLVPDLEAFKQTLENLRG